MPYLILLLCLAQAIVSKSQTVTDMPDHNDYGRPNVTASRLAGTWTINTTLTERLRNGKRAGADSISFVSDTTALALIPEKHFKYLQGKPVFLSGYIVFKGQKRPFLLTEADGNTHLVYFRDSGGIKYDDGESFILFIAVSADKKNDLLFTGGDFNNQPFRAWDRVH